jgi:hypothetical protein
MRKKIIFLAVCAVLLLFFASSSYGELDPKYIRLTEHPWNEADLSSPHQDNTEVSYYLASTNNRTINIWLVKIFGCNIMFVREKNSISLIKSLTYQPPTFREK